MNVLRQKKGFTLIEIIFAVAILGIIIVAFLAMFGFGFTAILDSGSRTNATMRVQSVVEALNAERFPDNTAIKTYMDGKGYNYVSSVSNLEIKAAGKDVNYYIGALETVSNVPGYEVTIRLFFNDGKDSVEITTFVIQGGT
jgi:prepilin-type N-terminal cleavage/methylation domain-containing protein